MFKEFISRDENQLSNVSYLLAKELHNGQTRDEGSPYITHPEEVVNILLSYGINDNVTISAGFLHDTIEDCEITYYELVDKVGFEISDIVDNVTKTHDTTTKERLEIIVNCLGSSLVKAADRLHNMRSLVHTQKEKRIHYCRMTKKYFIPFLKQCEENYCLYAGVFESIRNEIEELIDSNS